MFTCMLAERGRPAVRQELEAKRDQLVQNYVQEQRKLYSELVPEVNANLFPAAAAGCKSASTLSINGSGRVHTLSRMGFDQPV